MQLDLVECGMCGKAAVVAEGRRSICDACREQEQELYSKVKDLIRENPGAGFTIRDMADILKVDERKIHHLVNSGYFKLTTQGIQLCKERNQVF
jgi:hypothetical protein